MNVLTIAGSDPSAGAGIQSDIKTFSAFDCYGLTAVTAITSQNSTKFSRVEPVSPGMLASQIGSLLSDFEIGAVKIGMVWSSAIIRAVHRKISRIGGVPVIVDPVMRSTSGGRLLQKGALRDYKKYIVPMSTVMTPNVGELKALSGEKVGGERDIPVAVGELRKIGAANIVVTGFEKNGRIFDHVFLEDGEFAISNRKISGQNHGSGCSYSAALAASMARGGSLAESVRAAKKFTYESIKNSSRIGMGLAITGQKRPSDEEKKLRKAIDSFSLQNEIWNHIPECQTNFVYAKTAKPKTTKDILGLEGRIVRSGEGATAVGAIVPGGSRHVASAVLEMNRKFSSIRSGVNIRYDPKTVSRIRAEGMGVASYDRGEEPKAAKKKEGSSVSWGIRHVLRDAKSPYDAVFHRGDVGKEPMIIVFGEDPKDVIRKVSLIV